MVLNVQYLSFWFTKNVFVVQNQIYIWLPLTSKVINGHLGYKRDKKRKDNTIFVYIEVYSFNFCMVTVGHFLYIKVLKAACVFLRHLKILLVLWSQTVLETLILKPTSNAAIILNQSKLYVKKILD